MILQIVAVAGLATFGLFSNYAVAENLPCFIEHFNSELNTTKRVQPRNLSTTTRAGAKVEYIKDDGTSERMIHDFPNQGKVSEATQKNFIRTLKKNSEVLPGEIERKYVDSVSVHTNGSVEVVLKDPPSSGLYGMRRVQFHSIQEYEGAIGQDFNLSIVNDHGPVRTTLLPSEIQKASRSIRSNPGQVIRHDGNFLPVEIEVKNLNSGGTGWANLQTESWFPRGYLKRVAKLVQQKRFPYASESTYLVRDFDHFDLRNTKGANNSDIAQIFKFVEREKRLLGQNLDYDRSKFDLELTFAEVRVSSKKAKYETPHFDGKETDYVLVTPLTRPRGTLYYDPQTGVWREASTQGNTYVLSTSKKSNPTFHLAPGGTEGVALVTRYRLVEKKQR